MKFNWCRELKHNKLYPEYHFKFSLDEDEFQKVIHKYGLGNEWIWDAFDGYSALDVDTPQQMYASLRILQDATIDNRVDLGINYKQKYEELVELLNPHKIDDDMSPVTTLRMILRYHK